MRVVLQSISQFAFCVSHVAGELTLIPFTCVLIDNVSPFTIDRRMDIVFDQ